MRNRGSFQWTLTPKLDGEPCPFVILEGNIAKRVAGLSLIREDLRAVREMLYRIRDPADDLIGNKALLFGALSLYGKCFTQARGRGIHLDPKAVFQRPETKESHYRLMEMRHRFVAHGGQAREEQLKLVLLLNPDKSNKAVRGITGQGVSVHGLDGIACDECLEMIDEALEYMEQALEKAHVALVNCVAKLGVEWAYENAIWPDR